MAPSEIFERQVVELKMVDAVLTKLFKKPFPEMLENDRRLNFFWIANETDISLAFTRLSELRDNKLKNFN